ncbi:protein of unknown function [Stenotrophomonas maltophilia]|nr:protein of unknown function [Stenotrophomonas maltophilia]
MNPDPSLRTQRQESASSHWGCLPLCPIRGADLPCLTRHMRPPGTSGQCPRRIEWTGVRPPDTFRRKKPL